MILLHLEARHGIGIILLLHNGMGTFLGFMTRTSCLHVMEEIALLSRQQMKDCQLYHGQHHSAAS